MKAFDDFTGDDVELEATFRSGDVREDELAELGFGRVIGVDVDGQQQRPQLVMEITGKAGARPYMLARCRPLGALAFITLGSTFVIPHVDQLRARLLALAGRLDDYRTT